MNIKPIRTKADYRSALKRIEGLMSARRESHQARYEIARCLNVRNASHPTPATYSAVGNIGDGRGAEE